MIRIDGSSGEGGGQILRSSLGLSIATGKAFRIKNIRPNREQPSLLRQHLAAVLGVSDIGVAEVEGANLGSKTPIFVPGTALGTLRVSSYSSAGSGTAGARRFRRH